MPLDGQGPTRQNSGCLESPRGAFTLPSEIHVDGGRDGLSGDSALRFVGNDDDKVIRVSETKAIFNDTLVLTWTSNLIDVQLDPPAKTRSHGAT